MLLNLVKPTATYALIYEIGSGSVKLSIVESTKNSPTPNTIWSKRELITPNQNANNARSIKKITATTIDLGMLFVSEGMRSLLQHNPRAKITQSYATLSAPWSYTIAKNVTYSEADNAPFTIESDIISQLVTTATTNTKSELDNHAHVAKNLKIINHRISTIESNGYEIKNPIGQTAQFITVSHITSLTQTHIDQLIHDVHAKLLPQVELEVYSFMLVFYATIHNHITTHDDYCLIHVTNEAVELGVVRNKKLSYCTHFGGGIYSLIHEISHSTEIPLENVAAYVKEPTEENRNRHIPTQKQAAVATLLEQYQQALLTLFGETDELLVTPKIVYLYCNEIFEPFLTEQIQKTLCSVQRFNCGVKSVSRLLRTQAQNPSTIQTGARAHDISALFFHMENHTDQITSN